ncbi:serine hydrolase domain-containing protein [Microbacterium sp. RD1]|uniref:serine hydrolase domain-containing protein n=1 Tax=Microbacterium sp. RD1 TaxID=3457313 RepID=UPI003FA60691
MPIHRRRGLVAAATGVAALLAVLTGCSAPQSVEIDLPPQVEGALPDETLQQLEAAVTSAMGATGASGAIVGVWVPWSGSWVTGMGTQGTDGEAVDVEMAFRAADVTRAMTCDVLFQVAAEGTVDLDDAVTEWVNGFPDLDEVTLQQLCDGTAGMGSYAPYLQAQFLTNPAREWDPRELAGYGMSQERTTPGAAFRDSDAGYLLLGAALERATGESMSALISEHVAQPLDLQATSLPSRKAAPPSDGPTLHGHWSTADAAGVWNCAEPPDMTTLSASMGGADSGAVTDIRDLGRYVQALATQALTPDAADRFSSPLPVAPDQPTWFTAAGGAYQAGSLIGQFGSIPGYITAAFADPETGLTVAVVLNNSGANAAIGGWLAWELAAIASKAPAASGQTAPAAGLPWTAQQYHDAILANAICAPPAA